MPKRQTAMHRGLLMRRFPDYDKTRTLTLYLGNGWALEIYLVVIKISLAIDIMSPITAGHPMAIIGDLVWWIPHTVIAAPLLIVGLTHMVGAFLNYRGLEISWAPRFAGAVGGCFIWAYIVFKSIAIGQVHTGLFPFAGTSFFACAFIALRAWNRLPIPPGALTPEE